jgi:predicted HicB family RNase H-like nuclease
MKTLIKLNGLQQARNYKYSVLDISEAKEIGFQAIIPAFPKLYIVADNVEELHETVVIAITEEIKYLKKNNLIIPKPDNLKEKRSGRFVLRLRPEVHETLINLSEANNISLNQFLNQIIEEKVC